MLYKILLLSFLLCSTSWATVPVERFPSGTPVQVCVPSDSNSNCGGTTSLTVGTTTITSGTNTYLEENNNGKLGEIPQSTFLLSGGTATNSSELNGQAASYYQTALGFTPLNATKLGTVTSTDFCHGDGSGNVTCADGNTYLQTLSGAAILAGIAGGQTLEGGTLTTNDLTFRANAADLTSGYVHFTDTTTATNTALLIFFPIIPPKS